MANVSHATLTDPNLHEPKGAATAAEGSSYIADGAGSGSWKSIAHGRIHFVNISTPNTTTYPGSYTKLNPTTTASGDAMNFTEGTNARLTYTGSHTVHAHLVCTISLDQAAGANRDIRCAIYVNGTILASTETIQTTVSGDKVSTAIHGDVELSTNDYIEVYVKNDGGTGDVRVYNFYLFAMGLVH